MPQFTCVHCMTDLEKGVVMLFFESDEPLSFCYVSFRLSIAFHFTQHDTSQLK
jgi:hypothetical protein